MTAIKATRTIFLALLLCCTCGLAASAEVAVPPLTGRVVDLTGTLTGEEIAAQTHRLKDLAARKGSQVAVLIVPTTQPETIEQYSIRVAEAWKIGRRKIDDGALLVIAKDDHRLRIEVGYGLEGSLTDVTARRIIDEDISPQFRRGDFYGGIAAGLTRIIGVIDGEPLPAPAPEASHGQDLSWIGFFINPVVILIYIAVGAILRHILGRLVGSVAAGGVIGAFAWYVMGSIVASVLLGAAVFAFTLFGDSIFAAGWNAALQSGRGGGRSGGSSSGRGGGDSRDSDGGSFGGGWSSGGGSSNSDSGFSGGGGSFGGGGASGSW